MSKYIDAEKIPWTDLNDGRGGVNVYVTFLEKVARMPAADVVEVKHGRWRKERVSSTGSGSYGVYQCSICGAMFPDIGYGYNYCPNCGAKMDEEDQPKRFWPEQVEKIMIEAIAKAVTKSNKDECVVGCDGICEECPMGKEKDK